MVELAIEIAGLRFRNPVLSASGTYGHGLEMRHFSAPALLGGLVSKTVTPAPRHGNPAPRIAETRAGFLNSIGLENRGVESYAADVLPTVAGADTKIVTNIGGESVAEYAAMAERLGSEPAIDAFEVNLSCPNVQGGRLPFATDPEKAFAAIAAVRSHTRKPIFAKLSPNVTDIGELARACEAAGADAITAINTLLGMAVDWRTGAPGLATLQGGYSGPAIKPVALRCAWTCARAVSIPVIGCGGIAGAEDALEFLAVGCRLVQIGTAAFAEPDLPARIAAELGPLLAEAGFGSVHDVIGILRDGRERERESGTGHGTERGPELENQGARS